MDLKTCYPELSPTDMTDQYLWLFEFLNNSRWIFDAILTGLFLDIIAIDELAVFEVPFVGLRHERSFAVLAVDHSFVFKTC